MTKDLNQTPRNIFYGRKHTGLTCEIFFFNLFELSGGGTKCFLMRLPGLLVSLPELVFNAEGGSFAFL